MKKNKALIICVSILAVIAAVVTSVSLVLAYWSEQISADISFSDDAEYNASERYIVYQPIDASSELINFESYNAEAHGALQYDVYTDTKTMLYSSEDSGITGEMATSDIISTALENSYSGLFVTDIPVLYNQVAHGNLLYNSVTSMNKQIYKDADGNPAEDSDIAAFFSGGATNFFVEGSSGYVAYNPASSEDTELYGNIYYAGKTETDCDLLTIVDGNYLLISNNNCPQISQLYVRTYKPYDPVSNGNIVHSQLTAGGYTLYYSEDYVEFGNVISIAVTRLPAKVDYAVNESLDITGMIVTASYEDGSALPVRGYTCSGYSTADLGGQVVTVTYHGVTTTFSINVVEFNYIYFDPNEAGWWYNDDAQTSCLLTFSDSTNNSEEIFGEPMSRQEDGLKLYYVRYVSGKTVTNITINRLSPTNKNARWNEAVSYASNTYSLSNNLLRLHAGSPETAEWVPLDSENDYIYFIPKQGWMLTGATDDGWLIANAVIYCYVWYSDGSIHQGWPGTEMTYCNTGINEPLFRAGYDTSKQVDGVIFSRVNPDNRADVWNQTADLSYNRSFPVYQFQSYSDANTYYANWISISGGSSIAPAGEAPNAMGDKVTLTYFHKARETEIQEGYNLYVGKAIYAFAVVGYNGIVGDVIIPDTHQADSYAGVYDIKMVGSSPDHPNESFGGNTIITSVTLGKNVNTIGNTTFRAMEHLKKIKITGTGSIIIGDYCFVGCSQLEIISSSKKLMDTLGRQISTTDNDAFTGCNENLVLD